MTQLGCAEMRVADRKITDTPGRQALVVWLGADRRRTQRRLAKILGAHQGAISEWVRGLGRPSVPNAISLFHLAGIAIGAWLTERERKALALVEVAAHELASEPLMPRPPKKDDRQLILPGTEVAA